VPCSLDSETRNPKPETRNLKPETQTPGLSGESALQFLVRIFLARVTTIDGGIDFKDIKIDQLVVAAYSRSPQER